MCAVRPINESKFLSNVKTREYLLIINLEVDIESVHDACLEAAHQVLHHRCVVVALAGRVIHGLLADLDAC